MPCTQPSLAAGLLSSETALWLMVSGKPCITPREMFSSQPKPGEEHRLAASGGRHRGAISTQAASSTGAGTATEGQKQRWLGRALMGRDHCPYFMGLIREVLSSHETGAWKEQAGDEGNRDAPNLAQ